MVKRKQEARECDEEAPYVFRRLRRAYYDGLMSTAEYEVWYEKFLVAKVEKDCKSLLPDRTIRGLTWSRSVWHAQNSGTFENPRNGGSNSA